MGNNYWMSVWRVRFIIWVMDALFVALFLVGMLWLAFVINLSPDLRFLLVFLPVLFGVIFIIVVVGIHRQIRAMNAECEWCGEIGDDEMGPVIDGMHEGCRESYNEWSEQNNV